MSGDASFLGQDGTGVQPQCLWVNARGQKPWCVSSAELAACFLKEDRTPSALSALSHSFPSDSVYLCFFMNQLSLSSHTLFFPSVSFALSV